MCGWGPQLPLSNPCGSLWRPELPSAVPCGACPGADTSLKVSAGQSPAASTPASRSSIEVPDSSSIPSSVSRSKPTALQHKQEQHHRSSFCLVATILPKPWPALRSFPPLTPLFYENGINHTEAPRASDSQHSQCRQQAKHPVWGKSKSGPNQHRTMCSCLLTAGCYSAGSGSRIAPNPSVTRCPRSANCQAGRGSKKLTPN